MAVADFSRINSNIGALNALNSLNNINKNLGMYQMRLATGKRINSAADDPAGLTIANSFRTRNDGLKVALSNIGDSQNLISVAESGVSKIQDILIEMRNKAEAAASDSLGDAERTAIKGQLDEFAAEIDNIAQSTQWNKKNLLDGGAFASDIVFQTGSTTSAEDRISLALTQSLRSNSTGLNVGTQVASTVTAAADLLVNGLAGTVDGSEVTTMTAGATTFTGMDELQTGTYKLTATRATNAVTLQLTNANTGEVINIDQDGADGGAAGTSGTMADITSLATYDFGNGLQVALSAANFADAESFEVQFDYTEGGYSFAGSVADRDSARTSMDTIDTALGKVESTLQTLGSTSARLSFREQHVASAQINTEAAFNRIMNADMASSQLEATKYQILQQTATSMLAQANQAPQGLLSLFR